MPTARSPKPSTRPPPCSSPAVSWRFPPRASTGSAPTRSRRRRCGVSSPIKGRPETKPLLVLVDSVEQALALAVEPSAGARALMARHWPGPLTLVLRAAPTVPVEVTAGSGTVGIRVPGHAVALGLVRAAGRPVTAPSANPSGAPPPTLAAEVARLFPGTLDLILDGGATAGGEGSTVADCTVWPPRILRQGPIRL